MSASAVSKIKTLILILQLLANTAVVLEEALYNRVAPLHTFDAAWRYARCALTAV